MSKRVILWMIFGSSGPRSRTIRLDAALFERIMEESEKTGVSFNKIVNQCITYAFQHYREPKVTPDGR